MLDVTLFGYTYTLIRVGLEAAQSHCLAGLRTGVIHAAVPSVRRLGRDQTDIAKASRRKGVKAMDDSARGLDEEWEVEEFELKPARLTEFYFVR